MSIKRPFVHFLFLCVLVATFSGCVDSDENETTDDTQRTDDQAHNDVDLEDLKRCVWPKGEELVDCKNRGEEVDLRTTGGQGVCIAEFQGAVEATGARLRWHPEEGNHSLRYWSESTTPVFGVIAVTSGGETSYFNWNQGTAAAEVALPALPEQANVSVLVFRTWLQSGSPVPSNHTFRVDWDLVEGVDSVWPVRVIESDGAEYHLQPAMEIHDDPVFKRQWHDFMEVEGNDFHWVVGYKKLVRGDHDGDTRLEAC